MKPVTSDIPDFSEEDIKWLEDHIFNKMHIIGLSFGIIRRKMEHLKGFEVIREKMQHLEGACKGIGIECRISFEEARKRLKDQGGK